jgi:hypothetical protein
MSAIKELIETLGMSALEINFNDGSVSLSDEKIISLQGKILERYFQGEKGFVETIKRGESMFPQLTEDQKKRLVQLKDDFETMDGYINEVSKKLIDFAVLLYVVKKSSLILDTLAIEGKISKRLMPEQVDEIQKVYDTFGTFLKFVNHKIQ